MIVIEEPKQCWIDEQPFPSSLDLFQNSDPDERLQVGRCRLSLSDPGLDQIADATIGLNEDDFGQFAAVYPRSVTADPLRSLIEQTTNRPHLGGRPLRRLPHCLDHEEQPWLPSAIGRDRKE